MRIERVRVSGYGPLEGVDLELDAGLNVIFGRNEAGKTTVLDVILARLFRWERRRGTRLATVMGHLDRFGDPGDAAGRLRLRLDGELLDYPGGPSLLHHLELEHAGLAGLFCVRSGELELPQTEPGEFWSELKKVLSGLPRGVEALREEAHEAAGLTPTGQLSDAGSPGRKTRLAELRERQERLEELADRLPEAADCEERIVRLAEEKEALERARRARVAELHRRREALRERLEETPEVPRSRLDRWAELERTRSRLGEEIDELEEELAEHRDEVRELRVALDEHDVTADRAIERAEGAREARLAERARDWRREREELAAGWAGTGGRLLGGGVMATAAAAVALEAGTGLLPGGLAAVSTSAAVVAALGGWLLWRGHRHRTRRRELERRERSLLEEASARGLEPEDAGELPAAVRRLEDRSSEARRSRDLAAQKLESARERVEETEEELEEMRGERASAVEELEEIRSELGFESLESAREARELRDDLEAEIDRRESALTELAGPTPESWSSELPDEDDAPDETPEWDPGALSDVERRLEEARAEYDELKRDFVQAGLSTPEDVLTELRECRARIREIELDRKAGLLAGEIFGSMDEALEERLEEALSREGDFSVSDALRRITGRYERVERDGQDRLVVRDREGRRFRLEKLSRGARDQIYLALRIGLAGSALEAAEAGESGFLLLDDAFLTADWERRERMVEAAANLAERGWQVIYLTCDTHLRELFEDAGARTADL